MPPKAGGTSMKWFANQCTEEALPDYPPIPDNLFQHQDKVVETLLKGETLEIPFIIPSHMSQNSNPLIEIMQNIPRSVLLIYVHREEISRVKSAIKQQYNYEDTQQDYCDILYDPENLKCISSQDKLISMIKSKPREIGSGESEILTCGVYDALKNNVPNMLFMNYKQIDKLQSLLAKRYCPKMAEKGAIHANPENTDYATILTRVGKDKDVYVADWLEKKSDILSYALGLRDESNNCQGLTRDMEDHLFGCETEFVRWLPDI